jgi:DeoR/GlpR family transcriptional regulator of sugar metabolism
VLSAQRKDLILDTLRLQGRVVAKDMAAQLDLSEDTIRRDLRELAAEGRLHRVYGGALPSSPAVADFTARAEIGQAAKAEVGRLAAGLVLPGQTVAVDGGTTALQLARHLPRDLLATVVTHSPTIAVELASHPSVDVVIVGGRLFKHSVVATGAAAHEAINRVSVDAFFMGVTGIHPEAGLTTGDADEAAIKRAWSQRAAETFVLGSAEKIGAASPFEVVPLAAVTAVLTDSSAPARGVEELRAAGVEVRQPGGRLSVAR